MATDPVVEPTPEAFERLYRRHVGDVYRYALSVVRDPGEAEDLTQATFLRAWRAFRSGTMPQAPQNWLLSITHNVLRTHFRDRARRPREVELPEGLEAPSPLGPSAAEVLDALAGLPLTQREAIVMRELEGRSYVEIAEILGVSRAAVEALIFRARRSLRVRRSDLGRLGAVQAPASMASFVRERGAAEAVAALVGSGSAAKAAAVVAAGVVAAGVGNEALDAVSEPPSAAPRPAVIVRPGLPPVARPAGTAAVERAGLLPRAGLAPAVETESARQPAAAPAAGSRRGPLPAPGTPAGAPLPEGPEAGVVERADEIAADVVEEAPLPALPEDTLRDAPATPAPPPAPEDALPEVQEVTAPLPEAPDPAREDAVPTVRRAAVPVAELPELPPLP